MKNLSDIKKYIEKFKSNVSANRESSRDTSFDYCYNYFYSYKNKPEKLKESMIESCLYLWSYLGSWGMLRASSNLLKKCNFMCLKNVIEAISESKGCWDIDIDDYNDYNKRKQLIECRDRIEEGLTNVGISPTETLITKIMLGVFGNIVALDTFVYTWIKEENGKGITKVNDKLLNFLIDFYHHYSEEFKEFERRICTLDIEEGETGISYTKAKLIDMYGFEKGKELDEKRKKKNKHIN